MNDPDRDWEEFAAGRGPGGGPPPSDDDRFRPCFRHAERRTGITCQRCDRPICGECMRPASVGFQCPVCVADQAMNTPRPHPGGGGTRRGGSAFGGFSLSGGPVSTTAGLMVAMAAVGLVDLVAGGLGTQVFAFYGPAVASGQLWRLVTSVLVAGGLLNVLLTLLFLWFVGRSVEAEVGRWRLLTVLLVSGLGGCTALMWFLPESAWGMAYGAILGLLAAVAVLKRRSGEDIRGDLVLLALMVFFSVAVGSTAGWVSHLGAIVAGAGCGAVMAYARRRQALLLAGLGALLLALCLLRVLV